MIFASGELPDELVDAHKSGRLVVFVGSGASMSKPTCAPGFRALAERVIAELGVNRELKEPDLPEFVLDELAEQGLGVHYAVHRILSEPTQPSSTHGAICKLAVSSPPVRVVTTNYDRFLSSGDLGDVAEFTAPDLPGDEDFKGLVYLHGSIAQEPEYLVVTRSDFARAYMVPLSPTLAFLHRLFTSKPVLFIGYSADDVLMRYVLQAAKGRTELYSLRSGSGEPERDVLGVMRIPYGQHCNLPALLEDWASFAGATPTEHNYRVGKILTAPDGAEAMEPHDESYLARVVTDLGLLPQFTKQARGAQWRRWITELPQLDLFDSAPEAGSTAPKLQMWFAQQSGDDYTAEEVARLVDRDGGTLPDWVWSSMLNPSVLYGAQDPDAAGKFLVALSDVLPPVHRSHCARALGVMLSDEPDLADETFLELAETWCALSSCLIGFRNRDHGITDFWSARPHLVFEMMSIVDACLRRANRIATIFGGTDPSSMRVSLHGRRGGDVVHRGHLLVDAARDLIAALIESDPQVAIGYMRAWAASQQPILNRLAIHGWTLRGDENESSKLTWLRTQDKWVRDPQFHYEVKQLIASCAAQVGEPEIESLIEHIKHCASPGDEGFTVDKLDCIRQHAPESPAARSAHAQAQNDHANAAIPERVDDANPYLQDIDAYDLEAIRRSRAESAAPSQHGDVLAGDPARSHLNTRRSDIEHIRDTEAVASFIAAECLGRIRPGSDEPWRQLPGFITDDGEPYRVAFIDAVTSQVLRLKPDERSAQWRRWMRDYWQQRLQSRPRVLSDTEASALADWAALLDSDDFDEALELVISRPTGLRSNSKLPLLLLETYEGSDSDAGVIDSRPNQVVQLLAHLLAGTEVSIAEYFIHEVRTLAPALFQRVSHQDAEPLREQAARLALQLGD